MHTNKNTIAIHITNACNLRCPLCYLKKEQKIIPYQYIQKAIILFNPEYIVLFGGEAILFPDIIKRIHKDYPNIKLILHTNGTTFNSEIYDICSIVYMTIESFFYRYNQIHRNMTYEQYKTFLKSISYCRNKIEAIHNIYPSNNDLNFFKMAELGHIKYTNYLMISSEKYLNIQKGLKNRLWPRSTILTNPKIRILVDGTVTRDMTGHYNICHIDKYKSGMDRQVPVSNICKQCKYYGHCCACNLFPHFCKEILEKINYRPAFCKLMDFIMEDN